MGLVFERDLQGILDTLELMEEMESAVSEFYRSCAEKWPSERDFWTLLAYEELEHRANITVMRRIVSEKPRDFDKGRPFNVSATRTIIKGVREDTGKIKNDNMQERVALAIARDIENAFIESHYPEILKTSDNEYTNLVQKISRETEEHSKRIRQRLQELTG